MKSLMVFRHETIFSFDELLQYEPQTRLHKIFDVLDLHLVSQKLSHPFSRGPHGYNKASLVRALIAKCIYGIPNTAKLVERLESDIRLRYDCGFPLCGGTPSEATFSRLIQQLSEDDTLESLFNEMVQKAFDQGIMDAKHVAIDASKIDAYEKTIPRKKVIQDGEHADWGSKLDTNGNQITWFGYKLHAAVDTKSELPIALKITPANENDGAHGIDMMNLTKKQIENVDYFIMDMGYDIQDIYKTARNSQAQAIIPLNLRNEKIPPAGLDKNRTPICSMGYTMVYWGSDKKSEELKFRCPHVCGKVDCPMGSHWCSSSNYGYVVKKQVKEDPRSFCIPHRGTKNWVELYNERTSVERFFSRIKGQLLADDLTVGGIKKVKLHILISSITLIAGTLAANQKSVSKKAA
jgi:transposase